MDKVTRELDYQYSGYVSDATALSLCQRLGAEEIVFGQLDELDNGYILHVKMLDVETGSYALLKKYEISRSSKTEQLLHHAATIYKSSLGFVAEGNKNSISHVSPVVGISFDYSLIRRLSLGVKALVSFDALEKDNTIYTIEPLVAETQKRTILTPTAVATRLVMWRGILATAEVRVILWERRKQIHLEFTT